MTVIYCMVTNIDPEEAYPIILYIVVAKMRRILNIEKLYSG